MRLLIARHGNTFGPDQVGGKRIVMAGCKQDLPLVATGREQAKVLATYLAQHDMVPTAIYANQLLRTSEYATIIAHTLALPQQVYTHDGLLELDYGAWGGLNTAGNDANSNEVIAKFGQDAWDDWQQRRIIANYPPHNWSPSAAEVTTRIRDFFTLLLERHRGDDLVLAIGSQGSMALVNELLPGGMTRALAENRIKVATGNFCELLHADGQWQLVSWNQQPYIEF